jgi:hypothetical protein
MIARACYVLATSALLLSCSNETGPISGSLDVHLSSPEGDDGAALFTVTGGPIEKVEAVGGVAFVGKVDGNTTRVIVGGSLNSGVIAHLHIADMGQAGEYSIVLDKMAVRSTYAAREPAGYSISLSPGTE